MGGMALSFCNWRSLVLYRSLSASVDVLWRIGIYWSIIFGIYAIRMSAMRLYVEAAVTLWDSTLTLIRFKLRAP